MQFRLTYQGLLLAETSKGELLRARASHKHEIRKVFHLQLRRLWETHPALRKGQSQKLTAAPYDPMLAMMRRAREHASLEFKPTVGSLADRFSLNKYRFVPLLTKDLDALCSVDVLFLRNEPPGSALRAGDIDNRLKTLFDALTRSSPAAKDDLPAVSICCD